MYNTIQPINIVYRKPQDAGSTWRKRQTQDEQPDVNNAKRGSGATQDNRTFPNGERVSVDYTKNSINVSQILTDFHNTVSAIKAPQDITDEINLYLSLVEKESLKESPDKGIITSNLKNASRIADKYIADALQKPSRVVEGWIDALFMQNVVLNADSTQINEKFQMIFPNQPKTAQSAQAAQTSVQKESEVQEAQENPQNEGAGFTPSSAYYQNASGELLEIINQARNAQNPQDALELYNQALELARQNGSSAFVAAIHYEKGKIYDDYEHIDSALNEYNEATAQTPDDNLRSLAHLKMAKIYDDYVKYEPALEHYHSAIAYSGEANNPKGQTSAVKGLSTMFADRYDVENTLTFSELTIDCAKECDTTVQASAYSSVARNYESIGKEHKALEYYGKSVQTYGDDEESCWQVAQNYLDASNLMRKLGNDTKADSLLSKHLLYLDKARQS